MLPCRVPRRPPRGWSSSGRSGAFSGVVGFKERPAWGAFFGGVPSGRFVGGGAARGFGGSAAGFVHDVSFVFTFQ